MTRRRRFIAKYALTPLLVALLVGCATGGVGTRSNGNYYASQISTAEANLRSGDYVLADQQLNFSIATLKGSLQKRAQTVATGIESDYTAAIIADRKAVELAETSANAAAFDAALMQ